MMPNGNAQSDSEACLKPSGAKLRADAESAIWVCALEGQGKNPPRPLA